MQGRATRYHQGRCRSRRVSGVGAVMDKSHMSSRHLQLRTLFVDTLAAAGWQGTNINRDFDRGLDGIVEASMRYTNAHNMSFRFDYAFEEGSLTLYIDSADGRTLGLVFKCADRPKPLLDAVVQLQDTLAPGTIKESSEALLAACPQMFKMSGSAGKLVPVTSSKKTG